MKNSVQIYIVFMCVLFNGSMAASGRESNVTDVLPRLSCVLMKSVAYGLQRAISEHSTGAEVSNLSRAVREVNVSHYLSDLCPEVTKQEEAPAGRKGKRNGQHSQILANHANATSLNSTKEAGQRDDPRHELHSLLKMDVVQGLLHSFEEVTNALKSQLVGQGQAPHTKYDHAHAANAAVAYPTNAVPISPLNASLANASTPGRSSKRAEESSNGGLDKMAKSRHAHAHQHKKHKHTKSKETAEAFPLDDDTFTDDLYISERLKQDGQRELAATAARSAPNARNKRLVQDELFAISRVQAKHEVKRSIDAGRYKFTDKKQRHSKMVPLRTRKFQKHNKGKGKTYHKRK